MNDLQNCDHCCHYSGQKRDMHDMNHDHGVCNHCNQLANQSQPRAGM